MKKKLLRKLKKYKTLTEKIAKLTSEADALLAKRVNLSAKQAALLEELRVLLGR